MKEKVKTKESKLVNHCTVLKISFRNKGSFKLSMDIVQNPEYERVWRNHKDFFFILRIFNFPYHEHVDKCVHT